MKLLNWIKKAAKSVKSYLKEVLQNTGLYISNAYDALDDAGKVIIPIGVNVAQALKTFVNSPSCDVITSIITTAIPGQKDDIIVKSAIYWLKKELPKIAVKLEIAQGISNLTNTNAKVEAIIHNLQLSENKGALALEFATQLSLYLSDGELTMSEIKAAANDYYNKFVKK